MHVLLHPLLVLLLLLLHGCLILHSCDLHRVHLIREHFLERWGTGQLFRLLVAVLAHLGLDVPEVLVLRVVLIHPSIAVIRESLHGA